MFIVTKLHISMSHPVTIGCPWNGFPVFSLKVKTSGSPSAAAITTPHILTCLAHKPTNHFTTPFISPYKKKDDDITVLQLQHLKWYARCFPSLYSSVQKVRTITIYSQICVSNLGCELQGRDADWKQQQTSSIVWEKSNVWMCGGAEQRMIMNRAETPGRSECEVAGVDCFVRN